MNHQACIKGMDFPWIFHGGQRPTKNVGSVGGREPPPRRSERSRRSERGFCRPLPRPPRKSKIHGVGNPWGGKSLEIHKTSPGFLETQISPKSQGLKTSWSFFTMFFENLKICIMFRYWIFDAVPAVVVPEFFFRKEVPFWIDAILRK